MDWLTWGFLLRLVVVLAIVVGLSVVAGLVLVALDIERGRI